MNSKLFLSLTLLFVFGTLDEALFALTLEELSPLVRSQNASIKAAEKEVEAAKYQIKSAQGKYFPTLEVKGRYTELDDSIEIKMNTISSELPIAPGRTLPVAITPPPYTVQKKQFNNGQLVLTQPLFWGGQISAGVAGAEAQKEEASANQNLEYQKQMSQALIRYMQLKQARESVLILKTMEEQLTKLHKIAVSLVTAGTAPKLSVMKIEVSELELQSRLREAENGARLAEMAFKLLVPIDEPGVLNLTSEVRKLTVGENEDFFKTSALKNREEQKVLWAKKNQLDAVLSANAGSMLPHLYAFGKYELMPDDLTALEPRWAMGVGIDIPLTAGITQVPERLKIKALKEKVEILQDQAQKNIAIEVEKYFSDMKSSEAALQHIERAIELATESLRLTSVRYRNGDSSEAEVLDSANQLEKLQLSRWQHLVTLNTSIVELYRASGNVDGYITAYQTSKKG